MGSHNHTLPNVRQNLFMNNLILLSILVTVNSFGQEKDIDINKHLIGRNFDLVNSLLLGKHKDFFFVNRDYNRIMSLGNEYDTCSESNSVRFIIIKANDSNKYQFLKYNNCGQSTQVTINSEAIQFFQTNRNQIKADSIAEKIKINPSVIYSLYEFIDGKLRTYKHFCKECIEEDKERATRKINQNLKLYMFFDKLDNELTRLIK